MSSVDKLFRDKLAGHREVPSAAAWNKVEAKLAKKNNRLIWWRIAAVLALAALLSLALLKYPTQTGASELTVKEPEKTIAPAEAPEATAKVEVPAPTVEPTPTPVEVPGINRTRRVAKVSAKPSKKEVHADLTPELAVAEVNIKETVEAAPAVSDTPAKASVVLTYTLPSIKPSTSETANAAVDAEPQKGIQKLWEAAKVVKNSDNPWGELREAKNELLAFEFKKDKNREKIDN